MSLSLYACGGAGVNIAKSIRDPNIHITFIDTSVSNLKTVPSENIFLVDGMDGAGKNQAKTYGNFKDIAEDVLVTHKPSDKLNVVISSLSGGSGGISAVLLTRELVKRGLPVIVIGIDSRNSVKEIDNSVKSLKNYKSLICDRMKKPVSMYFIENGVRSDADRSAVNFISLLSLLVDKGATDEFDTSDLKSLIYFDTVTDNHPTMSILEVNPNDATAPEKGTSIVGTVLVTKDKASTIAANKPEYFAMCVVTDPDFRAEDIRLNSVLGKHSIIIGSLEAEMQSLLDSKRVNKVHEVELSDANDDGVFL